MNTAEKMRIARWLYCVVSTARKLFGAGNQAQVMRDGFHWALDLTEGIDLAIFVFGGFSRRTGRTLTEFVRPGSVVLDIGANIGAYTLFLSRLVGPEGKVYAFEPTDYAFNKLQRNLGLNREFASRVIAEQAKLVKNDDDVSAAEIYSSWKVVGNQTRHPKHLGIAQPTTGAKTFTLDSYCERAGVKKIDFIKLDVDGFESDVIAGALTVLQRDRPVICLELAPYALTERGSSLAELLRLLHQVGYNLVHLENQSPVPNRPADLAAEIPSGAGIDVLAVPEFSNVEARPKPS